MNGDVMELYAAIDNSIMKRMDISVFKKMPINYLFVFHREGIKFLNDFAKTNILIDSGAYFFNYHMNVNSKEKTKEFIQDYYDFIEQTRDDDRIKGYFDMDMTYLGLHYIKRIRRKLFSLTPKIIPAYHTIWGLKEFKRMCKQYNYIALGCSKNVEIPMNEYSPFVKYAHLNKCKVHGLGLNDSRILKKVPFDSADSHLWLQKGYWDYYNSDIEKNKENNKIYRPMYERQALWNQYQKQIYFKNLWADYDKLMWRKTE